MATWRHCIVSLIDVTGIKKLAAKGDGIASAKMREMHSLVFSAASHGLKAHAHAYLWNDSALLLAFVDADLKQAPDVLREVDALKAKIDCIGKCYAVSVKGKAFPELEPWQAPAYDGQIAEQPRAVVIKASSYAMANCFLIEEGLGKKFKKPWAVDGRIAKHIETTQKFSDQEIELLPNNNRRAVRLYDGPLW